MHFFSQLTLRWFRLLMLIAAFGIWQPVLHGGQPAHKIIVLNDVSGSVGQLNPPDTTQAMLLQLLDLIALSGEQTQVALVHFGGTDGLSIIAGDDGLPTSASATIKHRVLKDFPKPAGATPMDRAFEVAQSMVSRLPSGTAVTVVLIGDGHPDSGQLRPKDFTEVSKEIDRQRTALLERCRSRGYPDKIMQECLRQQELLWNDPTTKEFLDVYRRIQVPAEYRKVLQCAAALAKAKIRFVTVDFAGGIPELREIHQAANGVAGDLVVSKPDEIIRKLHALGLTELPGVVKQDVLEFPEDTAAFQRDIAVAIDPLAARSVVTIQFHPAVSGFEKHLTLSASIAGATVDLSPLNQNDHFTLALDGKGNLATVTFVIDTPPADGKVTLHIKSPDQSLHIPAASAFTHFRLRDGIEPDLRPDHAESTAAAPFRVSSSHAVTWKFGLIARDVSKAQPLTNVDAVLRNGRNGEEHKLTFKVDPLTMGQFLSEPVKLSAGQYDVVLHIITETGATFRLTLARHIESGLKDEAASVQIPFSPDGLTQGTSCNPCCLNFGVLGDELIQRTIEVTVRTREIDYLISVVPHLDVFGPGGQIIPDGWIKVDHSRVPLAPGRAEKMRLTLRLPETYEDSIEDGQFTGLLTLTRTDTNQPLELKPFEKIAGIDDSEPINRVLFVLSRPQLEAHSPWAGRDWLKNRNDGQITLPIQVSMGLPLTRTVNLDVTNTSSIPRIIKVLPGGRISDASGNTVPGLQLVPDEATETAREVAPGETARWVFHFAADASIPLAKAFGTFQVTGAGLRSRLITVPIHVHKPLLAARVRTVAFSLTVIMALFAVVAFGRAVVHGRLSTGRDVALSNDKPWAGLFSIVATKKGAVHLIPETEVRMSYRGEKRTRPVNANQPIPVNTNVSPEKPLCLEFADPTTDEPRVVEVTDLIVGDPGTAQVRATVASGGASDRQARTANICCLVSTIVALTCCSTAMTLSFPLVLSSAQWLYDAVIPVR